MFVMIDPPAIEPVDVALAKAWLRVDHDAEDALITALIETARRSVEAATGRCLVETGWTYSLRNAFAAPTIVLPKSPVLAVASIAYVDLAEEDQTVDQFVIAEGLDGVTSLRPTSAAGWWPSAAPDSLVTVTFTAGYVTAAAVADLPAELKTAVLMTMADLYENRQSAVYGSGSFAPVPVGAMDLVANHVRVVL